MSRISYVHQKLSRPTRVAASPRLKIANLNTNLCLFQKQKMNMFFRNRLKIHLFYLKDLLFKTQRIKHSLKVQYYFPSIFVY